MSGSNRGFVWLTVILAVALVTVVAGGAFLVVRERERAATEKQLAAAARQRLAEEKRKTAEAERRAREAQAEAAARGGNSGGNAGGGGLAWLGGRRAWVVTKTRPAKDYCAILRRAGVKVRCAYATNKVNLHVLILRCPNLTEARGRALLDHLGLKLRVNNWQRKNACGKYHEITIYLND